MLIGLIWFIQILAYPQYLRVGEAEFRRYHLAHCWRVGFLTTPLIAIEAATATGLLYQGHREWPFLISVGLIIAIWLSTAVYQAPLHLKLMAGPNVEIVRQLMRTNWLRTVAWTARGALVGYVAGSLGSPPHAFFTKHAFRTMATPSILQEISWSPATRRMGFDFVPPLRDCDEPFKGRSLIKVTQSPSASTLP